VSEWETTTLGEFTTLQRGHDLPKQDRREGDVPILGSFGITGWHDKSKVKGPGVTVGRSGASYGVVSYSECDFWPLNTALFVKDFHGNDERFAYYFLQSIDFKRFNSGSAVQSLNRNHVHPMEIRIPPLPEQRAIASILGALDDKIELNRRMNATLESLARAIFKSWFVDFDPVHANAIRQNAGKTGAGQMPASSAIPTTHDPKVLDLFPSTFQDSDLGPIPDGWSVKRLEELTTEIGSGATPRGGSKVYVEEGVALVRSQNVFDYEFVWDGLARITDEAAKKLEKLTLQEGDVLFNITGASILRTCIVDPRVLPARVNQHVARIRAAEGVSPYYLHEYLARKEMKDQMIGLNAGATREAITKGHLQNLEIIAPSTSVLEAFDEVTQPLYRKKQEANAESFELGSLRDTLLPQLLSGELPVPEFLTATEEALV